MGILKTQPVSCETSRGCDFPRHWVSTSYLHAEVDGIKISVPGFGASTRRHRAIISSCAEAHEHFWSQPRVQCALGGHELPLTGLNRRPLGVAAILEVLGLVRASPLKAPKDATGIAFGASWEDAVRHGLLEVLERHLVCMAWAGNLPMTRTFHEDLLGHTDQVIPCILSARDTRLPFALAMVRGRGFTAIGAKCSLSFAHAASGALAEAIMLHQDYHQDVEAHCNAPVRHLETLQILRDPDMSDLIESRFTSNVVDCEEKRDFDQTRMFSSIPKILEALAIPEDSFSVAEFSAPSGKCVRVLSSACMNPRSSDGNALPVPFL